MNKSHRKKNANAMKRYEVMLYWTQYNKATITIKANSLADAEAKADEICSDEIDDWNPVDGELWVESVDPCEEDKSHE
ncbi:MAG: hypothetical protein ABSD28_08855 [Tepidisphaeraceae bacterium]|jgi:hypothetical protein